MTMHTEHPSIPDNGLDDSCPRCAEHAERPFQGLDHRNLSGLIYRVQTVERPRTTNEAIAMAKVRDAIAYAEALLAHGWIPNETPYE